jgi:predicted ATPase
MSPQRWRRVKVVFEAAVELSPSDLEQFLRVECASDAELDAAVRQMLEEDQRTGLLDHVPPGAGSLDPEPETVETARDVHEAQENHWDDGAAPAGLPELIGGRYEKLGLVGSGGMGEVYRSRDWVTGDTVALKRIRRVGTWRPSGVVATPAESRDIVRTVTAVVAGRAREEASGTTSKHVALAREFRVLASLRHPNIIPVLDYGFAAEGYPFFTMTLLEGAQRLTAAAAKEGLEGKLELLFQVLQALCYLHRHGILHRDLKPSNILVSGRRATVVDFGLAGVSASQFAGTPDYIAPELWRGERPSTASDLYAFGVVAFQILNGRGAQQPDPEFSRESAPIWAVIARLLARDPAKRYSDANEAMWDLAAAAGQPEPVESIGQRESYLIAAPLVGRRKELSQLTRALRVSGRGAGRCLLLGGESGVGKTRLIEEMRARALVRGALALSGRAEEERAAPYSVFKSAVLRMALLVPLEDAEAGILKMVFPDIENVLRRRIPDAPADDPETVSDRLAASIVGLFRRYGKPVLFAVEDCHNLQEDLSILRKLSAAARSLPLLILAPYRSDERPGLPGEFPEAALMPIGRLDGSEIRAMSVAMLGQELGGNETLFKFLERETEGNAFFLVEAVRALAEERGSLAAVTPEALPEKVFARGIQDIVQRRLRKAPLWARDHLQLAAIMGREVNPEVLTEAGVGKDLDRFLLVCDRLAILEGDGYQWRFTHEKVREGVLKEVDPNAHARLHRSVASAIEKRFEGHPDWFQTLMFHWREGGVVEKSTRYALMAAGQMLALGLPEKAVEILLEGLSALGERIPAETGFLMEAIGSEAERAGAMLAHKPFEELLDLPALAETRVEQIVQMLKLLQPAAHISQRAELFALSALKCMRLTLEHGAGPWVAEVFAVYAAVLRGMTQDSRTAKRYIQLAAHYDHKARGRLSSPVAFLDAWFIHHWLHPVKENLRLASEGAASAASEGDILYHGFCASSYVMYLAASGAPLAHVVEAADRQTGAIAGRVRVAAFHCLLERQFALALAGRTESRLSLTDASIDEERDLAAICVTKNFNQIPYYYASRMRLHYYYGEYERAIENAARALPLLPAFRGQILQWILTFYRALSLLGLSLAQEGAARSASMAEAEPLAAQVAGWAAHNPEGFGHMSDLIQAEWARVEGDRSKAAALFGKAASGASALGATHDLALVRERAADLFLEWGERERARIEFRGAVEAYSLWGANAKVSWLNERFPA